MVNQETVDIQQGLPFRLEDNRLAWTGKLSPLYNPSLYPQCTDWLADSPQRFSITRDASVLGPDLIPGVDLITHTGTLTGHGYIEKNLFPVAHLNQRWGTQQNFSCHVKQGTATLFALEFFIKARQDGDGTVTFFNKPLRVVFSWSAAGVPEPLIYTNLEAADVTIRQADNLWQVGLRGPGASDFHGTEYSVRIYPTWGRASEYVAGKGTYMTGFQLTKTSDMRPYSPVATWGLWTPII